MLLLRGLYEVLYLVTLLLRVQHDDGHHEGPKHVVAS
jgi:hypothetical protein